MTGFSNPVGAVSIDGPVTVDVNNPVSLIDVRGSILGNSIAPGASMTYNIAQFGTLTLSVNSNPAEKVALQADTFTNEVGNNFFNALVSSEWFTVNDTTETGHFALPVVGKSIKLTNLGLQPIQLWLFGHTRSLGLNAPIVLGSQNRPRLFQSAIVATPAAGTLIPLTSIDSGPSSTCFNGQVSIRLAVTGATKPSFLFQMVSYDPAQSRAFSIMDSAGFRQSDGSATEWDCYIPNFNHPVAVVQWQARMSTSSTAPAVRFFLEVIPS